MCRDLGEVYWCNELENDILEFVAKSCICQQVKVEHQNPRDLSGDINIPTLKLKDVNTELSMGLSHTYRQHD